jgi:hypothetical protein
VGCTITPGFTLGTQQYRPYTSPGNHSAVLTHGFDPLRPLPPSRISFSTRGRLAHARSATPRWFDFSLANLARMYMGQKLSCVQLQNRRLSCSVLHPPTTRLPLWSLSTSLTHPSSSNEVLSVYLPRCGCMSRCSSRLAHCVAPPHRVVVVLEPPTHGTRTPMNSSPLTCLQGWSTHRRRLLIERKPILPLIADNGQGNILQELSGRWLEDVCHSTSATSECGVSSFRH